MVSDGMTCVKYLLFFFNLIFAITGVIFISVGAVILGYDNGYSNFLDYWIFAVPILMIIVGIVVFFVSFFGCCGAVKENHCMIITFSVLLLVIFALEVGAGISGYMMRGEVGSMLKSNLNKTMHSYDTEDKIKKSWDVLQYDLNCCGMNNSTDWSFRPSGLPTTCCSEIPDNGVAKCESNSTQLYTTGCLEKMKTLIEKNAQILGGVGLGIALVQLIGVIFACCLARSIRREYETVETTAH